MDSSAHSVVALGGTFDPIQTGHVSAFRYLLNKFRRVIAAPTLQNPFKGRIPTALCLRSKMIQLVLNDEQIPLATYPGAEGVYISAFEYEYVYQFVAYWRGVHDAPLIWAVGPDVAPDVIHWKNWEQMKLSLEILPDFGGVRATQVRTDIMLAHPALRDFIRDNQLYTDEGQTSF